MPVSFVDQNSITLWATDEELRSALEAGSIPTLLLVIAPGPRLAPP
jgi:hypothetical protein